MFYQYLTVESGNLKTYLWTAHFGDDLPGLVKDGQPFALRRVCTGQAPAQRAEQQVLETEKENRILHQKPVKMLPWCSESTP